MWNSEPPWGPSSTLLGASSEGGGTCLKLEGEEVEAETRWGKREEHAMGVSPRPLLWDPWSLISTFHVGFHGGGGKALGLALPPPTPVGQDPLWIQMCAQG